MAVTTPVSVSKITVMITRNRFTALYIVIVQSLFNNFDPVSMKLS